MLTKSFDINKSKVSKQFYLNQNKQQSLFVTNSSNSFKLNKNIIVHSIQRKQIIQQMSLNVENKNEKLEQQRTQYDQKSKSIQALKSHRLQDSIELISQQLISSKLRSKIFEQIVEKQRIKNFSIDKYQNENIQNQFSKNSFFNKINETISCFNNVYQINQNYVEKKNSLFDQMNTDKTLKDNSLFQIQNKDTSDINIIDEYMDSQINIPQSMQKEMFFNLKQNQNFQDIKNQLFAIVATFGLLAFSQEAHADSFLPDGYISYTQFINGVKNHFIDKVRILENSQQAEFMNVEGQRGFVNLITDPNFYQILQENKVDLSLLPAAPQNDFGFLYWILFFLSIPIILQSIVLFLFRNRKGEALPTQYQNIYDIPVTTLEGKEYEKLGDLVQNKKLLLIVNVASKSFLADKNYSQLVQLYNQFKDKGLEILAFPCNQFQEEEPGTPNDILQYARIKQQARFPFFQKCDVNGKDTHEIFKFLRNKSMLYIENKEQVEEIPYNFTKFLVSKEGKVVFYSPLVDPVFLASEIEVYLNLQQ